jgi:AbrB family looped-hinge helix DNA binding protein
MIVQMAVLGGARVISAPASSRSEQMVSNSPKSLYHPSAGFDMATTVTLSSKYQIVIPQEAREALSLSAGDELLVLSKPVVKFCWRLPHCVRVSGHRTQFR